jgi:MATE family multidrug resistance protein
MNRKILRLAVPNILSNITIPLLGLVDTALMGHLDNVAYLGAIALGSMIFNIIYWSLGFLRMGTVGFTSQAFGQKDVKLQNLIFKRGIFISLILATLVIIIHPWVIQWGIQLTESTALVKDLAAEYVKIRIWAAPAALALLVLNGWFLGMQNAVYPMIIAIAGNIVNIVGSYILVVHYQANSAGVAWGTVIAQYFSLLLAVLLYLKRYREISHRIALKEILKIQEMKSFFKVNGDIFLRTMGIIFVISFFTIESANISDNILAINSILFQFFLFFSFMLDGFANAAEALTGEYIGAKDKQLLKKAVKNSMIFGGLFSALFSLVYWLFGESIFGILTDNASIIEQAKPLLYFVVFMPLVSFAAFIYDGIFIGATASAALRNAMIFAVIGVFVPIYYFIPLPELERLWIAFLAFMAARGLGLWLLMDKHVYCLVGSLNKPK